MSKKIAMIITGIVTVSILLTVYIYGFLYYSEHYYPKTRIHNIDCGNESPQTSWEAIIDHNKDYSIEIINMGDPILLSNSKGTICEMQDPEDQMGKYLKKQNPIAWPVEITRKYSYKKAGILIPNEENITTELNSLINPEKAVKSKSAKLEYDEEKKEYRIIDDTIGNIVEQDKVLEEVFDQIKAESDKADVRPYYKRAKYTKDNKKVIQAKEKLDHYLKANIEYKRGDRQVTVGPDQIHKFLICDKNFKTKISRKRIRSFVIDTLGPEFNSVGESRTIKSPGSGTIKISGGSYGFIVSRDRETKELYSDIKNAKQVSRKPKYYQTARSEDGNEIGDTYVDISISDQELWYVRDGKVKLHTSVVTGDPTKGRSTPKGVFFVEYKARNYTMRKYNAFVKYWMPFDTTSGVGMHDASWRGSFGGSIYKGSGSHGCVNMPSGEAGALYRMVDEGVKEGTPVIVH